MYVLVNPMKMSTYCVEFNSCCCFLTVLLNICIDQCVCLCVCVRVLSFALSLILLICPPTAAYSTHNQRNLNATYRSLTVLSLCYCSPSFAHLLPLLPRALRCSNQCLRILLRALSRFDTTRLGSRLGSSSAHTRLVDR